MTDTTRPPGVEDDEAARGRRHLRALYRRNIARLGPNDVIVASYGGSGQAYLGNIVIELGLNYADLYTEELLPDGSAIGDPEHDVYRRRMGLVDRRPSNGTFRPWPRFIKTHIPEEAFAGADIGGVWTLTRDPRDSLYSWYRWRKSFAEAEYDKVEGSFADFLERPDTTGNLPVDDWTSFYVEWARRAAGCKYDHVTRFEDLKRDPVATMRTALAAFDVDVSDDELRGAVERSSFDAMRAREDEAAKTDPARPPDARMMRKGKVEGWREWITPRIMEWFAGAELVSTARRYGYAVDPADARATT